ncbi:MAG: NADH-quinone oxidoreductase subunit D [Euryarchaeota archaeon]|jgi:NADH-quinone oxidoreductase subunit D|nr:NADH-quinone oxidoreductase subunit D [Euryarchaeota archaeon]MBT3972151.1 NADH-quinone oxidoreductase subunit D [Euryarchaeota archaeon]MBT4407162.1 NADH-quinone oxidoreductase subunit D [Euryarchaeota archaeon]MBT6645009.1 NADH-quinone oxidoreductase subunit D [Euryarchaeota archaeon]
MAQMWITMGPQHPMTHGLWTLRVKIDGETVVDTEPELGYIHRGVEKICESRDFTQITPYCDRLCYASAMTWAHSYIYAAENLLEVEVPERAEYIRLIANEMQRIASHLMWLGAYTPDTGNLTVFVWCLRDREMFLDLMQELGGSRMHYNFPRVGGVKRDLPIGFADRARAKTKMFLERMQEYEMLLDESTIFLIRTQGVGYAKAEEMVNAGVTGPNVRAAGVNYDVRWAHPYSVYDEIDWEPSVEKQASIKGADCYDRYRVRMEEMRQSALMILDALDKIPGGADTHYSPGDEMILSKAPNRAPEGASGFHHFEDPRGESMFYLQGGGEGRGKSPYRMSIRSPMFITIPFVAKTMIGYKIADIPAIMGSFDPCIGETDR